MFHEKWGIFTDLDGNKISMVGSNNDTYSGLLKNHESFELNYSWLAETDKRKIEAKEERFKMMWEDIDEDLYICDLLKELRKTYSNTRKKISYQKSI